MIKLIPDRMSVDFLSKRFWCLGVSGIFLLASIILLLVKGLNYGVDFAGGTLIQIKTEKEVAVADVRSTLISSGFESASLQSFDGHADEFLIRLPVKSEESSEAVSVKVADVLATVAGQVDIRRTEFVGPQVGSELKKKGLIAILLSMAAILVYISARFEMRYAVGAVLALVHDVLLTVGVFSLLQKEITLAVLAALLTIVGYSLNDTIVVFDRVRENLRKYTKKPLVDVLNLSVNEMLNRTLMTSLTTLVVLVALFLFGGGVIHDFAFALLFGIGVGTYSSVFVASPIVLFMDKYYREHLGEGEQRAESE